MLRFIPPTPDALQALSRFTNRYLGSGVVQTWSNSTPMLVRCNQCGQPGVLITEYIGGRVLHTRIQCLSLIHISEPTRPY